MTKYFLLLLFLASITPAFAQNTPIEILGKMDTLYNQFDNTFESSRVGEELVIVYIPGKDNPFGKVYDRHKDKKLTDDVQFVGGFKEMMNNMSKDSKKKHLQEAFVSRYGNQHFTILLDLDSDVQRMLGNEGYTIAKISKKTNRVLSKQDFGTDRAAFFKALNNYLK